MDLPHPAQQAAGYEGEWLYSTLDRDHFLPFLLTLPDPRYFMPSFPALAILMAHGVRTIGKESFRIVTLALLLSLSSLWVYTDFNQAQPFCIGELTLQDSGIEDLSPSGDWLCPGFHNFMGGKHI